MSSHLLTEHDRCRRRRRTQDAFAGWIRFWLDSLNFRRETETTGWRVDVLLVFVDDSLVFKLVGGRPTINEVDLRCNPLGLLQGRGDQSLQMIR